MTFSKILCPTDFSAGAKQALLVAVRIARATGAELVIAHAWYVPASPYALEPLFPSHFIQQIIDEAKHGLNEAVEEAVAAGAQHVSGTLLAGVPALEIVDELGRDTYDLCIIGTHGRSGLARVMVGSVAEKVVRHSPCSVLAVRPGGEAHPFHHVLVPTDFSESAMHALDLAATLVDPSGRITLLHVTEVAGMYSGDAPIPDFARDIEQRAAAALEREVGRVQHTTTATVRGSSRAGFAGIHTLASLDVDPSIDLIVMGTHGRKGIKRVLLGSVAEKTVRHAHCPVLVVRRRA